MMSTAKKQKNSRRIGKGWLFLLAVLALYGVTAIFDQQSMWAAWSSFQSLAAQVLPVLLLVYLLIFVFHLFAEPKWLGRYVGKESGLKGWLIAVGAGILSLGPIYPWYAFLGELREKGMRPSLVAAFLYARAIKIPLLPLLVHYFGMAYAVTLVFYLLVFAGLTGKVMGVITGDADGVGSAS